jgi:hypothetical protein
MVTLVYGRPIDGVAILDFWRFDRNGELKVRQRRGREYWFWRLEALMVLRGWGDPYRR